MIYTIKNKHISVSAQTDGAQLMSVRGSDGTEYLWQGDPAYWQDRSPNIFPYIGRMIDKKYAYKGSIYSMEIHGFAPYLEFEMVEHTENRLVFQLCHNAETLRQYPWKFRFCVEYSINGSCLEIAFTVENKDDTTMLFAVGGHPGINVPLEAGASFSDYRLRFSEKCQPEQILITPDCFVEDHTTAFPLDGNNSIPLRHDLFDDDAIVLKNTAKSVTLENKLGGKSITIFFPQMEYIGFWHTSKTDAPFVCIEPWSSLPSSKGKQTDLEVQKDLLTLEPGKIYCNRWSMEIK